MGMFFLVAFYVLYISKSAREKKTRETAIFAAFSVMSLTNFVYTSIQPWLLVVCCAAFVMTEDEETEHPPQQWSYTTCAMNVFVLVLFFVGAYSVGRITRAQLALKFLDTSMKKGAVPDSRFAYIEDHVATSEAYWKIRAKNSMLLCRYDYALIYIRRARQYSSSPELLGMEAECLWRKGNTVASMCLMDTLSCMLPHVLRLKLILMRHNASNGKENEALRYASDIISTGAKYDTDEARIIIQEAKKYKKTYEKETTNDTITACHGGHIHSVIGYTGL